jgi:teichoic acid transport system ATP-binding protein
MADKPRRRSPVRLLAPLALLLCVAAFAAVVFSSDVVDGDTSTEPSSSSTETAPKDETGTERERPRRRRYTVKLNDSLGSISEKTGVSVERLEALNPDLDPQALVVGQKIKLRE